MDFEDELSAIRIGNDHNIGLFPHAYLIAHRVNAFLLLVSVKSQVVVTPVAKAVAIIWESRISGEDVLVSIRFLHLAFLTLEIRLI